MNATRRAFLLGLAAGAAAVTAPVKAVARWVRPPPMEWGQAVAFMDRSWSQLPPADRDQLTGILHAQAKRALGAGARYEFRMKLPSHYGRLHGVAWYRHQRMDDEFIWMTGLHEPSWDPERGFYLLGRFVT